MNVRVSNAMMGKTLLAIWKKSFDGYVCYAEYSFFFSFYCKENKNTLFTHTHTHTQLIHEHEMTKVR